VIRALDRRHHCLLVAGELWMIDRDLLAPDPSQQHDLAAIPINDRSQRMILIPPWRIRLPNTADGSWSAACRCRQGESPTSGTCDHPVTLGGWVSDRFSKSPAKSTLRRRHSGRSTARGTKRGTILWELPALRANKNPANSGALVHRGDRI
jgi:hypothetical protein